MKLLMISTDRKTFEKGSAVAQRQVLYAKNFEEVHIIVFAKRNEEADFKETALAPNIWVYPTRSFSRWMYVFDALKLGRFITEKRGITDITCQDPFETGLVGALVKSRHPVRLELQIHVDLGSRYFQRSSFLNKIRMFISKFTLARADKIRVVSKRIRDYVAMIVEPSMIEVRPIAIDEEKIINSPITTDLHKKYPQFEKIVLMASRLEPEKNISLAIESFKAVLEKMPKAGLVIVGSGSEEMKLKSSVKNLCLDKSVIFEGWQNDLASYYKTSDCFLLTSLYEGYGMTLAEAHIAGCKIVSTDVGIAREVGAKVVGFKKDEVAQGIVEVLSQ